MKFKFKIKSIFTSLFCIWALSSAAAAGQTPSGSCPANQDSTIKKLAEAECSSCHGKEGVSESDNIPNLAGQQPLYMRAWLAGCRKQGDKCQDHAELAVKLNNLEIVNLSEFYAHLPATIGN
jgi:cytochrome c553